MDKSMVKGGVFTLLAALIVLIVSGIFIATSAEKMKPQHLWTERLSEGQEITSGPIDVTGQFIGVTIKTLIERDEPQSGKINFSFPLTYTVTDSDGSILASFDGVLDSNSVKLFSTDDDEEDVNGFSAGVMELTGQTYYRILGDNTAQIVKSESFPVEKAQAVSVMAKLGNENVEGLILNSTISLMSTRISGGIFAGCFVCCLVPVLVIVGVIFLFIGLLK